MDEAMKKRVESISKQIDAEVASLAINDDLVAAVRSLDSEEALCGVRWSFVRKKEIHFAIERYIVVEIVGESSARTPTISQLTATKGKNLSTNLIGRDFLDIRKGLVLRLRNQATERQQQHTR